MPGTPHPTHGLRRPSQPLSSPTPSDPRYSAALERSASSASADSLLDGLGGGGGSASAPGSPASAPSSAALREGNPDADGPPSAAPAPAPGHPLKNGWSAPPSPSEPARTLAPPVTTTRTTTAAPTASSSTTTTSTPASSSRPPSPTVGPPVLPRRKSPAASSCFASSSPSPSSSANPTANANGPSDPAPPASTTPAQQHSASSASSTGTRSTPGYSHTAPSTSASTTTAATTPSTTAPTTSSSGTAGAKAHAAAAGGGGGGGESAPPSDEGEGEGAVPVAGLKGMAAAARQAKTVGGHAGLLGGNEHGLETTVGADGSPAGSAGASRGGGVGEGEGDEHPLSEQSLERRGYHSFLCLGRPFHVEKRWKLVRELGQGAYGLVVSAQDDISGETIAIKLVTRVLDKVVLARRALREITLLRHFASHENITGLIDLDVVHKGFNEVYMFMEPMEADLHQIIRSGQLLSNSHVQYFMYQLFRGMKFIHSAHVLHRDIKPGNVLVNADCELKICDFGLARGFYPDGLGTDASGGSPLTEYVATRWYRAPEIMLSYRRYTTAIDVWSIGCILGELLGAKPIFKGKDYVDQLNLILSVLGTPDDETLTRVGSDKACRYIRSLARVEPVDLATLFPEADPLAIDLLAKLLVFDPDRRISVVDALSHPYLASYHDESDEPSCPAPFDKWAEVESLTTIDQFRTAIETEVREFRAEVRAVDELDPPWTGVEDAEGHEGAMLVSGESPMTRGDPPGSRYVDEMLAAAAAASIGGVDDGDADNGGREESATRRPSRADVGEESDSSPDRNGRADHPLSRSASPSYFASSRTDGAGPASPTSAGTAPLSAHPLRSSQAHSRSASAIHHRRPSSGFFDPFGRRPTSLMFTPSPSGATSTTQSPANSSEVVRPPRSRHHSASGDALMRPLLRSLSTISVTDALGNGFALGGFSKMSPAPPISPPPLAVSPAPMAVSPSDAPPSAPPLQLRPSTEQVPLA